MARIQKKLNAKLYRQILASIPIPCVDLVITDGKKFLLVKRKNKPAKNKWCVPGGRVLKNETLKQAVKRKVEEETGLNKFKVLKFIAVKEYFSSESEFGPATHTINSIFLIKAYPPTKLKIDNQSSEIQWFYKINPRWIKYVRDVLKSAGFD